VGRGAILILDDGRKVGVISPFVVPKVAICDPALTLGLPPALTAATGMDAIAHCIETFLSPAFNPPADGIALDGLRRAWRHIERATRQPWRPRRAAEHDERVDARRAGVPEGARVRAQPEPLARRHRSAAASRHAERDLPAGRDRIQRGGRVGARGGQARSHGQGDGLGQRGRGRGRPCAP
jgi:hypothetical protein